MKPELSVIITTYNAEKTIVPCLEALYNQDTDKPYEIIVVDSSKDKTPLIIKNQFPDVRLYRFEKRKFCGDARNWGILKARSDRIAFIDGDCTASPTWISEILKAHQGSDFAIGGSIANQKTKNHVSWAAYFSEFSRFMPNSHPGWLKDMAGANVSYKRKVFDQFGPLIEETYCSDTEFHWRIGQKGHRIRFVPSIMVYHDSIEHVSSFIRHEYQHGRAFARVRVITHNWSFLKRALYAISFFLIAVKLIIEVTTRVLKNRFYWAKFLISLPFLICGLIAWSYGECAGYIGVRTNEQG